MTAYGHIVGGAPDADYAKAVLTADLVLGDAVVHVNDTGDFDELAWQVNGQLMVGVELTVEGDLSSATLVPYTTCDEDDLTITLTDDAAVEADSGDLIYALDPATGLPVVDFTLWVRIDGADETGDPIPVRVAHELNDAIQNVADLEGQAVQIEEDEDGELIVVDIVGSSRTTQVKAYEDTVVLDGSGDATLLLTYQPDPLHSEHLYWNGQYQDGDQWSRDKWTVTIPDPTTVFKSGDRLTMEYLYRDPSLRAVTPATLLYRGTTSSDNSDPDHETEFDLPDGTEVGDVLVLTMFKGTGFGSGDIIPVDSRMVDSFGPFEFGVGGAWPEKYVAGYAIATTLDPFRVQQSSGDANVRSFLSAYKVTGTVGAAVFRHGSDDVSSAIPCHITPPEGDLCIVACAVGSEVITVISSEPITGPIWTEDYNGGLATHARYSRTPPATDLYLKNTTAEIAGWLAVGIPVSNA